MKIFVTAQASGTHYWADAPANFSFLRNEHRHLFKVRLEMQVKAADREVEFLEVQTFLNLILEEQMSNGEKSGWSCETFAMDLLERVRAEYPRRAMLCEFSEDGENGAIIEIDKDGFICE